MKKCLQCGKEIKKRNKFCNSSCSATYNNLKRGTNFHSKETKKRISEALKGRTIPIEKRLFGEKNPRWCGGVVPVQKRVCKICGKKFEYKGYPSDNRKTCSRECMIKAMVGNRKYQNGSRKSIPYFNKHQNKEIILESSWELEIAELLDEKQIKWIRPNSIIWFDKNGKKHLYFPDFYLPKKDLYLDPKNEYCMVKDKEKMQIISQKVNIEFGSLEKIKEII